MSNTTETVEDIIKRLELIPHDEGGWFRETYRSAETVDCPGREDRQRALLTTIHYLLEKSAPRGLLHANASDIVHFYEGGGVLRYVMLTPEGELSQVLLGSGHERQLVVPGGVWKASELIDGEWGMVGEAVSPGFDYRDRQLADKQVILSTFPQHSEVLSHFFHD